MEVTVNAFEAKNLNEVEMDYLYRLRKAKSVNTLEKMVERLTEKANGDTKAINALNVAFCARERELGEI